MNIQTNISDVILESPIINASGVWCTSYDQLVDINNNPSFGAVVSKSCTLHQRKGNEPPKYYAEDDISINSNGLENNGIEYYIEMQQYMTKPYFISIAGFHYKDRIEMIQKAKNHLIELNLSCPNVCVRPIVYDPERLDDFLKYMFDTCQPKFLGLKLPPYFIPGDHEKIANVIKKYPIKFITCINSIPDGCIIKDNRLVIGPNDGYGGLGGGSLMKAIGMANVRKFKTLLPEMDIIGCGGISTGQDVFDYLLIGASAVQIGTVLHEKGPEYINHILEEFKDVMKKNNIAHIIHKKIN